MRFFPKTKFVSFDIFDTLLKRSVAQPSDLFRLMEGADAAEGSVPQGFAQKRIDAEKTANLIYDRPVTIEEIYKQLQPEFGDQVWNWMQIELQMELKGCVPNSPCVELFLKCLSADKCVILISDMYLSSAFIGQMLDRCGIAGYQKIYVSCEQRARKRDGKLFKTVLEDLRISPRMLTHIGDNKRSDFLMPFLEGIHVWFPVPNRQKELCKIPKAISPKSALGYRTLQTSIRNCSCSMDQMEKFGCACLGPLLLGFSIWLAEKLRKDGIHDVYFLSRDGFILQRAFELLGTTDIRTHYLYSSRRSYTVPLLYLQNDFFDTVYYIEYFESITIRSYLARLGVDAEQYREKVSEYKLDLDQKLDFRFFLESNSIKLLYEDIKKTVIENARSEYLAFRDYIESLRMPPRIAVVDIGHFGTLQHALLRLIKDSGWNITIKGYYLGTMHSSLEQQIEMEGYLYNGAEKDDTLVNQVLPLYENQFLLAPHGSVKRFVFTDGKQKIEFENNEFESNDVLETSTKTFLHAYQKGALKLVEYAKTHLPLDNLRIEPDAAFNEFARTATKPKLWEAKLFGDLPFRNIEGVKFCARPRRWNYYLLHSPKVLLADLSSCAWKVGFVKRLIKIPLPYGRAYQYMKMAKKKKK